MTSRFEVKVSLPEYTNVMQKLDTWSQIGLVTKHVDRFGRQ